MKIVQIIPSLAYGDAIGNETLAIRDILKECGYDTAIYAESVLPPLEKSIALPISKIQKLKKDDIAIYHLSTGTVLNRMFGELKCKKVAIYHNVTPAHYFLGTNPMVFQINSQAMAEVRSLADKMDYCIADSDYNKEQLEAMGYQCPIDVVPIILNFDDYKKKPDETILNRYQDGITNILFTGRVVQNKKFEDVIKAFYYYKKYFDDKARLFLVGSCEVDPVYVDKLKGYAEKLGVKDITFTGHIKFSEILAYFQVADIFLCMSEHEGFCVPLVEAMYFDIPIVARRTSAIPYTLGGSGVMLSERDALQAAAAMNYIRTHSDFRQQLIEGQRIRLKDFKYEKAKKQFLDILETIKKSVF